MASSGMESEGLSIAEDTPAGTSREAIAGWSGGVFEAVRDHKPPNRQRFAAQSSSCSVFLRLRPAERTHVRRRLLLRAA